MILINKHVGKYKIISLIGKGGQANVYLAQPLEPIAGLKQTPDHVALKILSVEHSNNPTLIQRFQNEVNAVSRLRHRHIIPIYEIGSATIEGISIYYYAMRYLEGCLLYTSPSPRDS